MPRKTKMGLMWAYKCNVFLMSSSHYIKLAGPCGSNESRTMGSFTENINLFFFLEPCCSNSLSSQMWRTEGSGSGKLCRAAKTPQCPLSSFALHNSTSPHRTWDQSTGLANLSQMLIEGFLSCLHHSAKFSPQECEKLHLVSQDVTSKWLLQWPTLIISLIN